MKSNFDKTISMMETNNALDDLDKKIQDLTDY